MSLQYLKVEARDKDEFLHADKHQNFQQVDFSTLGIKVYYKVMLLLIGMIKYSQSTQSNKFAISLQYLHVHKYQSFCKLSSLFLMEVIKHFQSTQNRKLVISL